MTKQGFVEINEKRCKACGICMEFCPKGVLEAKEPLCKAFVAKPDACILCGLCEMYCPDWAIRVVKEAQV